MKKTSKNKIKKTTKGDQKQQVLIKTSIGEIYITASMKLIHSITKTQNPSIPLLWNDQHRFSIFKKAQRQIGDYLSGKRKKIDLPYILEGTSFQQSVWREIKQIPFGEKISYQELAVRIKNPKALRAVGTAVGKNPLCLLIPCHRIICSNGKPGGFSMGSEIKEILLNLELKKRLLVNL